MMSSFLYVGLHGLCSDFDVRSPTHTLHALFSCFGRGSFLGNMNMLPRRLRRLDLDKLGPALH